MSRGVARAWHIKVTNISLPECEHYVFVDTTGAMPKATVTLRFWHTFQKDLFDRPALEVTYLRPDDKIELTASQLVETFGDKSRFIKVGPRRK